MLKGKRILIAGASRGIGRALAIHLARQGARLAIGARDEAALRTLSLSHPEIAFHEAVDFTDPLATEAWTGRAIAALGGLDGLLVTVTAGRSASEVVDMDLSYQLDWRAPVLLYHAAEPALSEAGGSVVLFSSRSAHQPDPRTLAYAGAKAALEFSTRALAAKGRDKSIRVNAIAPGSILTDDGFWQGQKAQNSALWQRIAPHIGVPDHITGPVEFLLSDAARWLTGQVILVDGGQTLSFS